MRQFFTYGSVRGAAGNGGPYRDCFTESSETRLAGKLGSTEIENN